MRRSPSPKFLLQELLQANRYRNSFLSPGPEGRPSEQHGPYDLTVMDLDSFVLIPKLASLQVIDYNQMRTHYNCFSDEEKELFASSGNEPPFSNEDQVWLEEEFYPIIQKSTSIFFIKDTTQLIEDFYDWFADTFVEMVVITENQLWSVVFSND